MRSVDLDLLTTELLLRFPGPNVRISALRRLDRKGCKQPRMKIKGSKPVPRITAKMSEVLELGRVNLHLTATPAHLSGYSFEPDEMKEPALEAKVEDLQFVVCQINETVRGIAASLIPAEPTNYRNSLRHKRHGVPVFQRRKHEISIEAAGLESDFDRAQRQLSDHAIYGHLKTAAPVYGAKAFAGQTGWEIVTGPTLVFEPEPEPQYVAVDYSASAASAPSVQGYQPGENTGRYKQLTEQDAARQRAAVTSKRQAVDRLKAFGIFDASGKLAAQYR